MESLPSRAFSRDVEDDLDVVAGWLRQAQRVLFITGAGISADSGLPTYRGVGGLYDGEATEDGLSIEDALSGEVLELRPDITWKYLLQIERNCRDAAPNLAHRAIACLERRLQRVMVFTQNVDGLHRMAGSREVVEIHGNLRELRCSRCAHREAACLEGREMPPRCPACGGVLRPEVVLFGEALPEGEMDRFVDALDEGFDLVFSIGTSGAFPYIAQPVAMAAAEGVPTVEINPASTRLSGLVDIRLPLGAAEAMSALLARLGLDPACCPE